VILNSINNPEICDIIFKQKSTEMGAERVTKQVEEKCVVAAYQRPKQITIKAALKRR